MHAHDQNCIAGNAVDHAKQLSLAQDAVGKNKGFRQTNWQYFVGECRRMSILLPFVGDGTVDVQDESANAPTVCHSVFST